MNERQKQMSPPYANFNAFINFINKLRDTVIPSRIDPTIFGSASGSISYSIISTLKFLKLIDESGVPNDQFTALVKASDELRTGILKGLIEKGYPSLFKSGVNLTTMTAGQFDEHMRTEYGVSGSTVDKIASFFISACKMADVPISSHLTARKPVATSSSAKKSAKQRKGEPGGETDFEDHPPAPPPASTKAMEYQLIDLMSEPDIDDSVKQSIWALVQYLTARKAKKSADGDE